MQLQPDLILQGRYRVVSLIAQGGMGAVYRAVDERLGRTVALKQTLVSDPALRAAFEREARLLAGLQHPALPVVSDHFSEGGGQFLVMQFIPGDDLATLLRQRGAPFPLGQVLPWARSLLGALDYLHSQQPPVIHRDIKPQNLKPSPHGGVTLLDFGLAKGLAGDSSVTSPSLFGYTPQYAPLEQIQGRGTDARSDLYSVGATCYELLTGSPPPDALTRAAAAVRGEPDPLRPASAVDSRILSHISDLLEQALALDPAARPPSARAMRAGLGGETPGRDGSTQALPGGPAATGTTLAAADVGAGAVGAAVVGTAGPAGARAVGRRFVPLAVAVGTALLLAALLLSQILWRRDARGGDEAATSVVIASGPTAGGASPAGPGSSFETPVSYGAEGAYGPLRLRVVETMRGERAWRAMYRANQFNDPPPEGYEYFLAKLDLQSSEPIAELYLRLAGARRVLYAPTGVAPAPLPRELGAAQRTEVWVPYLVAVGEADLVMRVETASSGPDYPPLHIAVAGGARLPGDPALEQIDPNELGTTHREPAPLGATAVMEDYEVTVLEQRRGPEVLEALIERYGDVTRPRPGYEYSMARLRVRYLGDGATVGWASVGPSNIGTVSTEADDPVAEVIDHPRVYTLPEGLPELDALLLPGGVHEGWTVVELPVGEPEIALAFKALFDPHGLNRRYFALR